MNRHINLGDPDDEPTDEELAGLMQRAFAGVVEAREASLRAMRERIASAQAEALRQLGETPDRGPR